MKVVVLPAEATWARAAERRFLEEGHVVIGCAAFTEAVEWIDAGWVDLVIAERAALPNGGERQRALRRIGEACPVLVVVDHSTAADRVQLFQAGADACFDPSSDPSEIVAHALALARRRGEHVASLVRLGELVVNEREAYASVGPRRVDLTPTETRILARLVKLKGRIATRMDLDAELRGGRHEEASDALPVHLSRLRTKLGTASALIETVRGRGYRLRGTFSDRST